MSEHEHTEPPPPETDDQGYRDTAEERAYEEAASEPRGDRARPTGPSDGQGEDDAVDAQAEPDRGEPDSAG